MYSSLTYHPPFNLMRKLLFNYSRIFSEFFGFATGHSSLCFRLRLYVPGHSLKPGFCSGCNVPPDIPSLWLYFRLKISSRTFLSQTIDSAFIVETFANAMHKLRLGLYHSCLNWANGLEVTPIRPAKSPWVISCLHFSHLSLRFFAMIIVLIIFLLSCYA